MPKISKQLAVMMRLTALLERINPLETNTALDAPFAMDLRRKVFRGRMTLGTEVTMPAVALLESPSPFDAQYGGAEDVMKAEGWRILVQGFAADDKDNPLDPAYELKAALEVQLSRVIAVDKGQGKPVFPEDHMLGNLISGLKIGQGVARPPEGTTQYVCCYLPLIVQLQTNATNPYVDFP